MKLHPPLSRYLAMLLFALLLLAAASGCDPIGSAAHVIDKNSSLIGKYTLSGEREVISEIELNADGQFLYMMSYGAHDEGAMGTWHSNGGQVILEVDKSKQGQTTPPPTDKLDLRRDGDKLVLTRNDNELVYLKTRSRVITDAEGREVKPSKRIALDIVGYNYTDKYIESFNVNGYGGGHIFLSSPTSGGGGPYCCFYYVEGVSFPREVTVEWANSASDGPWKKAKTLIPQPKIAYPKRLEIHIYPDGHVEGEMTEGYSEPRLKLTKKNENER